MIVEFEGQQHEFPDDFTDEEIGAALDSLGKGTTQNPWEVDFRPSKTGVNPNAGADFAKQASDITKSFTADRPMQSEADRWEAANSATVLGAPVVGPLIQNISNRARAGFNAMTGDTSLDEVSELEDYQRRARMFNPELDERGTMAGQVAGSLAITSGAPALFGAGANQGTAMRILAGGAGNAGLVAADQGARGKEAGEETAIAGALGAGAPIIGQVAKGGYALTKSMLGSALSHINPGKAADRAIAESIGQDVAAGGVMSPDDYLRMRSEGQPLTNADMFGASTRQLADQATAGSGKIKEAAQTLYGGRHKGQFERVRNALSTLVGGNVNRAATREAIDTAERKANAPAYRRAEMAPSAQSMWTPELQRLTAHPDVQRAIAEADEMAKKVAVEEGVDVVANPFVRGANGEMVLRDPNVTPNLRFWDIVKRGLDRIESGYIGSNKTDARAAGNVRRMLTKELDNVVPEYKQARGTAAEFFKVETALEAGEELATGSHSLDELERAAMKFAPHERASMKVGFVGKLLERFGDRADSGELLNFMETPNFRRKIAAVFPDDAGEIEQMVKTEDLFSKAKRIGSGTNSLFRNPYVQTFGATSAMGGGYAVGTGDWQKGLAFALSGLAIGSARRAAMEKLMTEIGERLVSGDPEKIKRAMELAAKSKGGYKVASKFLQGIERAIGASAVPVSSMSPAAAN